MPANANYARVVFNAIKEASKASLKEGFTSGGISYTMNYVNKTVSGTFVFPLIESEDTVTGGINFEVEDFLQDPTPPAPPTP